jgi:imidazole glycerol-phosphate synthase subunit HisF
VELSSVADVQRLLEVGADRVLMNTAAVRDPRVLTPIANRFGAQAVVVGIDARRIGDVHEVFTNAGRAATGRSPKEVGREVVDAGAGEIVLTSIDRDGTMLGYDLELVRAVADAVDIPVVASGGAGSYEDLVDAVLDGWCFSGRCSEHLPFHRTDSEGSQGSACGSSYPGEAVKSRPSHVAGLATPCLTRHGYPIWVHASHATRASS